MELEKLDLLRLGDGAEAGAETSAATGAGPARAVTVDDIRALVPEAVPGSIWGFVDAVGMRQGTRAIDLLERLLDATPEPVLLAVLHRRLRELIEVADRLAAGETPGSLVRSMRLQPFRAETLARQAHGWTVAELADALEGLLELDARVKGVGGATAGDAQIRLAFDLWVTDRVAPAA
jgi:DNA polymerase-3 subunit delta